MRKKSKWNLHAILDNYKPEEKFKYIIDLLIVKMREKWNYKFFRQSQSKQWLQT